MWSHKGSKDLILLPNDSQALWQAQKCHPTPLLTHCQYDHAGGCCRQQNVPHSISRLSRAQFESPFSCEEHRVPVPKLPNFVFSGKCQKSCMVLGCKLNPHLWMLDPQATLMKSVSDHLSRQMHICGLFEVILQGSSCSSLHKGGGSGPAAGLLPSYGLLHIQVAPPCSGHYTNRHSKPSCHSSH